METIKIGRPLKWESKEELIELINKYFESTEFDQLSVTGLALSIGSSRQLLSDYESRDEFKEVIREAKTIIENSYELSLRKNGRTGDIFALKNFGWVDKIVQEHDGTVNVNINRNVISGPDSKS